METRLERNKKTKKDKRIKKLKAFIILIFFGLMVFGLVIVNEYGVELGRLSSSSIFGIDFETSKINLFGKNYKIDFKILKEIQ